MTIIYLLTLFIYLSPPYVPKVLSSHLWRRECKFTFTFLDSNTTTFFKLKIVAAVCADLRGAPDEVSVAELLAIGRRVRQHDRDPHLFPSAGLLVLASLSPSEPAPALCDAPRVPRRQLRVALEQVFEAGALQPRRRDPRAARVASPDALRVESWFEQMT